MFFKAGPRTRAITFVDGWDITSAEQRRNLRFVYRSRRKCGYSRKESRNTVWNIIETTMNLSKYVEPVFNESRRAAFMERTFPS